MAEQFNYTSVLAPYIRLMLQRKEAAGIIASRARWILKELDAFANSEHLESPHITESFICKWSKTRIADSGGTMYAKYSVWHQLTTFMCRCGCECYVPRLPRQPKPDITPYIYTNEQIASIFKAADEYRLRSTCMNNVMFPMPTLLRLLYGTGMRISEALSVKNVDLHLDESYIHLKKTKNGHERVVPVDMSLNNVLQVYIAYRDRMPLKGVSLPDQPLFIKSDGTELTRRSVLSSFRKLLEKCKIPYKGNHAGPRIHDLRHTFAVHALVQMFHSGMDLYASLPILSTCLGHTTLSATEQYVRLTCSMYPELESQCSSINAFVYPKLYKYHDNDN
ncbi:tyrosine-type recombinase/integrase [Phocaeicola vulgatus]|uniref:tyrosine-type recombinase/integrase n=1 Tax=Phocaeicola vulgatus TaxID=821 RepID=UPI001922186A|nr:tyrosine-type recombinase/integrase [Phocaeicola vulgatus]MDB1000574.1 tyrosine-type recombinase/integrase [Phocaeicola vulgatus]MDB1005104.1 tyrosine-type recombinase/integrase [Phocaeicola vulgatus]MDC1601726.1 tyrosine-type recombinase/integrase [Phocaeicola vulgatus]MDC1606746.1 tyrosine-type recombinase/integrase [Phocaeicola vulgatus]MDC1615938.1 tyrosine-type recombinase/integrase [Phocaeicola vulgatus]